MSEQDAMTFYRLSCGCVVMLGRSTNDVRLWLRVVDGEGCSDFPEDRRFHCWRERPEHAQFVRGIPLHLVAHAVVRFGVA